MSQPGDRLDPGVANEMRAALRQLSPAKFKQYVRDSSTRLKEAQKQLAAFKPSTPRTQENREEELKLTRALQAAALNDVLVQEEVMRRIRDS